MIFRKPFSDVGREMTRWERLKRWHFFISQKFFKIKSLWEIENYTLSHDFLQKISGFAILSNSHKQTIENQNSESNLCIQIVRSYSFVSDDNYGEIIAL